MCIIFVIRNSFKFVIRFMIKISKLYKNYGKEKIVKNISLSIKKGSVFGFLGPNGAGKTTTIKMLVGLSSPSSGKITINNKDPKDQITRERIGFMPEDPYFYDHLTGSELLKFCGDLFNIENDEEYHSYILENVGLFNARNKMINTYSKGMKQRLGIAQSLVNDPDYIFLDEPLDGLDPIGRAEIKKIILKLKKQKKTIFFNSHILADVNEICDEIGIIDKGDLIYSGSIRKFRGKKTLEEKFVEVVSANNL